MRRVTVSTIENPSQKWIGYFTEATSENALLLTIEPNKEVSYVFAFMQFGQPVTLVIDGQEWSMVYNGNNEKGYYFR